MGALSCPPWVPHPRRGPSPPARKGLVPPLAPTCHPLLAPPWPGGLGAGLGLCSVSYFVCYSLRIKVCGSGSPRIHRRIGQKGPPPTSLLQPPPPDRQQPLWESLYLLTYISTPPLQNLCFPKNSYTVWGGGEGGAKRGAKRGEGNGDGASPAPGAPGEEGAPHPRSALGWGHRRPQPRLGRVTLLPYSFIIIIIIIPFFLTRAKYWGGGEGAKKRAGPPSHSRAPRGSHVSPPRMGGWGGEGPTRGSRGGECGGEGREG